MRNRRPKAPSSLSDKPVLVVHPIPAAPGLERDCAEFYVRWFPKFCKKAKRLVGWDSAMEAYQQTWLELLRERKWYDLPPEQRTEDYVFTIYKRRVKDAARRRRKDKERLETFDEEAYVGHTAPAGVPAYDSAEVAAMIALIDQTVAELPRALRETWYYIVDMGFTIAETAEAMEISYDGALKSWKRVWARLCALLSETGMTVSPREALKIIQEIYRERELLEQARAMRLLPPPLPTSVLMPPNLTDANAIDQRSDS